MPGMDITLIIMYLLGFVVTGFTPFLVLMMTMMVSMQLADLALNSFPSEYMYFLTQSMIWLLPAFAFRKSVKLALCSLSMCVYEWLVSIESFVWQYITPVETPMHSQYAFIIIGIHLFILSTTAKWGGEIGYIYWRDRHRFRSAPNL